MNVNAKWIWKSGENSENTWMNFIKTFELGSVPETAVARIAAESKYWLYINGTLAVFEGGLKRGPSKNSTYYDEIDIAKYLKKGENTVAILVEYFGKNGFSHLSSGAGGLLFETDINGSIVSSDSSWRVMKNMAYVMPDEFDIPPNFRLSETNIYFDASKDIAGWYMPGYDSNDWDFADTLCSAGEGVWGELVKRSIPMFKDCGLKDYINSGCYEGFTTDMETEIELRLPYNAQITPYLKITAPKGKKISIRSDNKYIAQSVMAVYYTNDGEQEYESFCWINGERIIYTIPEGVTVHSLKYRETGYDAEFAGSFECDDVFLNKLWQKSLRTLYVTMRDNLMDCPDRERAQWWGDVNIDMQMMMYCMDEKALLLYKKGAETMARWAEDTGCMLTVVPTGTEEFELPFQNLAGIWGFWYYYEYTGDISVPRCTYEMSKRYIESYAFDANGLVIHKTGSWDWTDWGCNSDIAPMENAWYYMAVTAMRKMAELLGYDSDLSFYDERIKAIQDNYNKAFLKGDSYYDRTENGEPDDRANALAILSGLADKSCLGGITKVLTSVENASPYMEKYVLDALCETGLVREAIARMRRRYKNMVEYDYSTLWEYWGMEGTLNHAWSGGPLITMSKYIAGIRPLSTAYKVFEIKPVIDELTFIKCSVPSVNSVIRLEIRKTENSIRMNVEIPKNTTANVYLPLFNNIPPKNVEHDFIVVGNYARFVLTEGVYDLKTTDAT